MLVNGCICKFNSGTAAEGSTKTSTSTKREHVNVLLIRLEEAA